MQYRIFKIKQFIKKLFSVSFLRFNLLRILKATSNDEVYNTKIFMTEPVNAGDFIYISNNIYAHKAPKEMK